MVGDRCSIFAKGASNSSVCVVKQSVEAGLLMIIKFTIKFVKSKSVLGGCGSLLVAMGHCGLLCAAKGYYMSLWVVMGR